MTTKIEWPGPDATHSEVQTFLRAHVQWTPRGPEPEHEAPPVENGPSIVCAACSIVRVHIGKPLCNACMVHT